MTTSNKMHIHLWIRIRGLIPENQLKVTCGLDLVSWKPLSNSDWKVDPKKEHTLIRGDHTFCVQKFYTVYTTNRRYIYHNLAGKEIWFSLLLINFIGQSAVFVFVSNFLHCLRCTPKRVYWLVLVPLHERGFFAQNQL